MVGILIALFIIGGFGALFFLAFNENVQGAGDGLVAAVKEQEEEIGLLQRKISYAKDLIERSAEIKVEAAEFDNLSAKNSGRKESIELMTLDIEDLRSVLGEKEDEFAEYKNAYRAYARKAAVGEKMPALIISTGELFKNVEIREVNSVGMQIRHQNGMKRIAYEELPKIMQDRFQFDEEQKQELIRKERELRLQHEAAVQAAKESIDLQNQAVAQKVAEQAEAEKIDRDVITLRNRAKELAAEIKELRIQIRDDMGHAETAGKQGDTRGVKINDKQAKVDLKLNQLAKLREMIREAELKQ